MANYNTKESVVDYLKSQGQDSSYSARKKLATEMGITNYSGSETQNIQLLSALKGGQTTTSNSTGSAKATPTPSNPAATVPETNTRNPIKGVDDATSNDMTSSYEKSQDVINADKKSNSALSNLEILTSKDQIISDDVMSAINSSFKLPSAITEADMWIANQLEKIQSGKTSYSDQVREAMDRIMNREKFSYDVDTDPLFQQALASAMNSGKQAMQDTIGQASALTGGYGSTYATTAGNQAYNSFIEDAYDNLPQYYQMAMEAYQMEGDEMYRQYSMLSAEDDKEFNRNVAAYDATYQHRNQMYNEAYSQYRDTKSDAFATANLQISEHGQLVSDAYNYYSATSDNANTLYEREYTSWQDKVSQATNYAQLLNSDYWNQSNQDFQASENEKQRDWQSAEAEKERAFTASENAKNRAVKSSSGSGSLKSATESQMKKALEAYNSEGIEGLNKYLNSVSDAYDKESIANYVGNYGELPYSQRTYTVIDDGGWNVGWGIDNNAKVKDQYGNEFTLKELKEYDEDIAKELSDKKYTVGKSYTKK